MKTENIKGLNYYLDDLQEELSLEYNPNKKRVITDSAYLSIGDFKIEAALMPFVWVARAQGIFYGLDKESYDSVIKLNSNHEIRGSTADFGEAYIRSKGLNSLVENECLRVVNEDDKVVYFLIEPLMERVSCVR